VEATRRPQTADPDFDPPPVSTVRLKDFDPLEHQRLVVNPFLAVFGLVVLRYFTLWLFWESVAIATLVTLCLMGLLPTLIQYHCLDCGKTGRYSRRGQHACPAVLNRWREGRPSRFPLPSSGTQLVVWVWLIGSVALLLAVLSLG
jgi:hypothetical protein